MYSSDAFLFCAVGVSFGAIDSTHIVRFQLTDDHAGLPRLNMSGLQSYAPVFSMSELCLCLYCNERSRQMCGEGGGGRFICGRSA